MPPAICSILRFLLGFALVLLDDSAVLDFASELLHTASPSEFCLRQVRYLAPPAPKSFHFTFSTLRLENLPPAWKFASGEIRSISPQFCAPVITKSLQPLVGDAATCRDYGRSVGNTKLAEIVVFLYKSTRASSTHKSYSVGQRHWARFQPSHPNTPFSPRESSSANPITLTLGFPPHTGIPTRILRHTTARSYICHVRHGGGTPATRKSFGTPPPPPPPPPLHACHQTRPPLPTRPAGAFILPSRTP